MVRADDLVVIDAVHLLASDSLRAIGLVIIFGFVNLVAELLVD